MIHHAYLKPESVDTINTYLQRICPTLESSEILRNYIVTKSVSGLICTFLV